MEAEPTTLADELRQIARNLDRAAENSAQYCVGEHHTAAIRRAADRLEETEILATEIVRMHGVVMDACQLLNEGMLITALHRLESLTDSVVAALAPRPTAAPDSDQHHVDELRRIMAADRPGGGS